ncbi:FtsL-like putative cell division protein [Hymenobacter sp. GOD-10R]|uniref:FtsL-like putative cell division protein n=1 Tax=Hymenobacter sp. GOD-10R TaxID=3093922 RepID=UPI002D79D9C5|nr:FtsL-like putative cell division protein [Hymenobacter sp. GOD-10R]WRQ27185.1 FtsL-like putative cell division protein [Hymenobacter sp. GOD-10R]
MALNTIKPPVTKPRANMPREVVAVVPEPVSQPTPEPAPKPKPKAERESEVETGPRSSWSVFTVLDRAIRMDGLFREGLPVRFLPHVLFIMFLTLVYIGNTHYGYRMNRNIQKLKLETEDLRADYTTLSADYMEASKQSEVARKVAAYGLVESSSPPFRINVPAGDLNEASLDMVPLLTADSIAARARADSLATTAPPAEANITEAGPPAPVTDLPAEVEPEVTPHSSNRSESHRNER